MTVQQWLKAQTPGYKDLSAKERLAIMNFSLLWSLFESSILGTNANVNGICAQADSWAAAGTLQAERFDEELAYFRKRYFADGVFTHHFGHLHFRPNDQEELVRAVIEGTKNDPRDRVIAVFIIIFRYRNNLFHGMKWAYSFKDQLNNFTNANTALMKILEQHTHY